MDEHDEPIEAAQTTAELQKRVDVLQSQITDMHRARDTTGESPDLSSEVQSLKEKLDEHSKQLEQSAEKLSQLHSENTVLRDQNQALNTTGNKKRRFNTRIFSKRFDAMQSMVERLPGVAPPIRRSNPDSYTDTPFGEDIASVEMPRKFSFPSIKMYDGTGDPDDHTAQYKQRMLAVALPKESREATMCKGFGSTLIGPALQWYINLPTRSISSFAGLSDKFVEQFASRRSLEKTSDGLYEILQHRVEPLTLVRLPSRSWPQNRRLHRREDRGQRTTPNGASPRIPLRESQGPPQQRDSMEIQRSCTSLTTLQDRVIHVISGGSEVGGLSHAAAKKSTRNAKHRMEMVQPKHLLLGTEEISFTAKEQEKILAPHNDALVISLTVANCLVKRILVDNGSSSNIIFQMAYQDLGLEENTLTRKVTPLISFSGEVKETAERLSIGGQHDLGTTLDSRHGSGPLKPSSDGRSGELSILLPDHLEGEDQGRIAITEKTSDSTDSGTRGQRYKKLGIVPGKPDSRSFQELEQSSENICRPLLVVPSEAFKVASTRKTWSSQDPRPPPHIDKITKNLIRHRLEKLSQVGDLRACSFQWMNVTTHFMEVLKTFINRKRWSPNTKGCGLEQVSTTIPRPKKEAELCRRRRNPPTKTLVPKASQNLRVT
uniref:Retrotransposon gag domain-containing protein n=1 Tax=Brassica oleracea var. oleracea TaxID=109376 RepID=A0A0D2ZPY2_BRAOL